ncbi:MAG: tRNA pseudouridine(55) synthase TruB [Campylobacterota bacterium]
MNRLFVANKPPHIGSNKYLSRLKRRYGVKKAGFSGTLDPFACGTLIIAFGSYTKLFNHLEKTPKRYRAVMWLGASSPSLDLENITAVKEVPRLDEAAVKAAVKGMQGRIRYKAPKFSAKKIKGKRAYDLARAGEAFEPPMLEAVIHEAAFLHYNHPFVTFEVSVSEGTYVRSLCEYLSSQLEVEATLSFLQRKAEGRFVYEDEKPLDPMRFLTMEQNYYADLEEVLLGKKLSKEKLTYTDPGVYFIDAGDQFAIIEVTDEKINYIKNKVPKCSYSQEN